jgi:AcrR family transcriptional regulator
MTKKRKYELKKRAEQLAQTRLRITEATVELHRTVGPAATQISEIARRAGVQRLTVYNHFPDEAALFRACSAHWQALHPTPDAVAWSAIDDPGKRLRTALRALYGWYRETEPMIANVLRDMEHMPAVRTQLESGFGRYLDTVRALLAEPFHAQGRRQKRIHTAVRAAVDFYLWRALAPLGDREAADLAAHLVEVAGAEPNREPSGQKRQPSEQRPARRGGSKAGQAAQ